MKTINILKNSHNAGIYINIIEQKMAQNREIYIWAMDLNVLRE